jgi:hypothetical protein
MQILLVLRGGMYIYKKLKSLLKAKLVKFVINMYTKRSNMNS